MAIVFWFATEDDPDTKARRARGERARGTLLQLEPLKNQQVWRFALYYFFVFGGFVALALWTALTVFWLVPPLYAAQLADPILHAFAHGTLRSRQDRRTRRNVS